MDKVVIIINNFSVGGAERLVIDDINEMLSRKVDTKLITLKKEGEKTLKNLCDISDANWEVIDFKNLYDVSSWWKLVTILKKWKPDLLITHLWYSNTIGRIAGYISRVPTIISFEHNVYDSVKTKKQFIADRVLQRLSTKIIAVSDIVKNSLISHKIKPSKIEVLLNAVNLDLYGNTVKEKNKDFTFLFIGRLIRQKGIDVLIKSFSKIDGSVLLIVGEGEDRQSLEKLSNDLGVGDRVRFLGVRHDIPDLLSQSDCFVLLSRWEGLSIVLLEAVASGIPIIVSDFEGTKEVITDMVDGIIVKREDEVGSAKAMEKVMSDKDLRIKLAENLKVTAKKFSIKRHVDTLLSYVNTSV